MPFLDDFRLWFFVGVKIGKLGGFCKLYWNEFPPTVALFARLWLGSECNWSSFTEGHKK
jgi:hypothetical protein